MTILPKSHHHRPVSSPFGLVAIGIGLSSLWVTADQPSALALQRQGTNVFAIWSQGLLQETSSLDSLGWATVPDANSPFQLPLTGSQRFYRLVSRGDNLWRVWSFGCDDGHDNIYKLERDGTPICGSGNCTSSGGLPDAPGSCWQNPIKTSGVDGPGSLNIANPQDYQYYGRTFLYVDQDKALPGAPLSADVGRVWLNDVEITSQVLQLNLQAGWNKLEFTSYNQNQGSNVRIALPLADYVVVMSSVFPGPSKPSGLSMTQDPFQPFGLHFSWEPSPNPGGSAVTYQYISSLLDPGCLIEPWDCGSVQGIVDATSVNVFSRYSHELPPWFRVRAIDAQGLASDWTEITFPWGGGGPDPWF